MTEASADAPHVVAFDLALGVVRLGGARAHAIVPADALAALFRGSAEGARAAFSRAVGGEIGRRAAERLGGVEGLRAASPEAVLGELANEIGLAGLGALGLERFGRALVAVIDGSPLGEEGDGLLEGVLGAAFGAATGAEVAVAPLGREGERARFLVTTPSVAERVKELLANGGMWLDAVVRLHERSAS